MEIPGRLLYYSLPHERNRSVPNQLGHADDKAFDVTEELVQLRTSGRLNRPRRIVKNVPPAQRVTHLVQQNSQTRRLISDHIYQQPMMTLTGLRPPALCLQKRSQSLVPSIVTTGERPLRETISEHLRRLEIIPSVSHDRVDQVIVARDRSQLSSLNQRSHSIEILQRNLIHDRFLPGMLLPDRDAWWGPRGGFARKRRVRPTGRHS